jgi:hypothetical protein
MKEPGDSDHEQEERNNRGEDLKRDRACVRQKVVLPKAVQQRPSELARPRPELHAVAVRSSGTTGRRLR